MKYTNAKVKICRDHCGPGFNGKQNINDVYNVENYSNLIVNLDLEYQ